MSRTVVSREGLLEWMNSRLQQHKECAKCHFSTVSPLAENDADGCNWAPSWLQCSGVPVAECKPTANRIVEEAKKLFNLEEA